MNRIEIPKALLDKGIYWTKRWDFAYGCTKISPGCDNCWNLRDAWRQSHNPKLCERWENTVSKTVKFKNKSVVRWTGKINILPERLKLPSQWRKPQVVAVNWSGDLFHENVPGRIINAAWLQMRIHPNHTFIVLTKRPDNLRTWTKHAAFAKHWPMSEIWPCNVVLAVSVESEMQMWRVKKLLSFDCDDAKRAISFEPLLGPVDVSPYLDKLDFIMVGGESGKGARRMEAEWPEDLCDQCSVAQNNAIWPTNFFFKQWGSATDVIPKDVGRQMSCQIFNGPFKGV